MPFARISTKPICSKNHFLQKKKRNLPAIPAISREDFKCDNKTK